MIPTTPLRAIDDGPIATADHLSFPRPAKLPADFAELLNDAWGDDSFPDAAATLELARRYETERPAYAEHGCSVEYTVASLVEELRAERDESAAIDRGVEAAERRGEL